MMRRFTVEWCVLFAISGAVLWFILPDFNAAGFAFGGMIAFAWLAREVRRGRAEVSP